MLPLGSAGSFCQLTVIWTGALNAASTAQVFSKLMVAGVGDLVTLQMWSASWVAAMSLLRACGRIWFTGREMVRLPVWKFSDSNM